MRDFKHTVGVLVKAYLNDTLEHGNCKACAVGNIVMASCDNPVMSLEFNGFPANGWPSIFVTMDEERQLINPNGYRDEAKRQIDSTGYTWWELAKIEYAFETAPKGKDDDEWMYNGLMAVVDVTRSDQKSR